MDNPNTKQFKKRVKHTPRKPGDRFGRLVILSLYEWDKPKQKRWLCQCDCGNKTLVFDGNLVGGRTQSCGCLHQELRHSEHVYISRKKHVEPESKTHHIWRSMHDRCTNVNAQQWHNYGERGITVCDRWRDFENFIADMGEAPEGLSLDRIDTNGNYEPRNCRWATALEQARNKRNNAYLTYNGRTQIIQSWSSELGIPGSTLTSRIKRGWTIEKAMTTPARKYGKG